MTAKKTDNRIRPHIYRVLPEVNGLVRAYATKHKIKPNEAAERLINGKAGQVVNGAAEILRLRAEVERLTKERDGERADRDAEAAAHSATRADLESAREATRRADAEVERLTRELTISEENTAAVRLVERREKELAEAKRTTDKLRIEVERVTEERDTERRLDVAAQEALRADVAREIEAAKRAEKEVERLRAELAATRPAPCACAALPDDLAPRLAAIAARRDVAPEIMLANVIKNGISKIEASDKYQDAQKAARART